VKAIKYQVAVIIVSNAHWHL